MFCGNYILHESLFEVYFFCVALDIIIYHHPATPHAVRFYASKALKGVWGENKSFPPTVFRNLLLFRILRQAEPLSVLVLILAVLTLLVLAVLLILLGSVLILLILLVLVILI